MVSEVARDRGARSEVAHSPRGGQCRAGEVWRTLASDQGSTSSAQTHLSSLFPALAGITPERMQRRQSWTFAVKRSATRGWTRPRGVSPRAFAPNQPLAALPPAARWRGRRPAQRDSNSDAGARVERRLQRSVRHIFLHRHDLPQGDLRWAASRDSSNHPPFSLTDKEMAGWRDRV